MKNRILLLLSIFVIVVGIGMNFNLMLMGSPATLVSFIITLVYILFWVSFILLAYRNRSMMVYSLSLGVMTLLIAATTLIVNCFDMTLPLVIPFVVAFLTPLYGIRYIFSVGFVYSFYIMIGLSAIWCLGSIISLKQSK